MNDLQREKFEKWWLNNFNSHSLSAKSLCFDAWCAAIESVVVELPFLHDAEDAGFGIYFEDVTEALDKAGIKYE